MRGLERFFSVVLSIVDRAVVTIVTTPYFDETRNDSSIWLHGKPASDHTNGGRLTSPLPRPQSASLEYAPQGLS